MDSSPDPEPDARPAPVSPPARRSIEVVAGVIRDARGRILLARGQAAGSLPLFEDARDDAARLGDPFVESIALTQIGYAHLLLGQPDRESFLRNLELAARLRNDDGMAYALEGLAATDAATDDLAHAGLYLGAAEALRARTGLREQRSYITYQPFVAAVQASDRAAEFEAARSTGRRMPRRAMLDLALGPELAAVAWG